MATTIRNEDAYQRAIKRNIVANAMATFNKTYGSEIVDFLLNENEKGDTFPLWRDFLIAYQTYGKLTEKQVQTVRNCIAKRDEARVKRQEQLEEARAKSNFVGEIGKRYEFNITIEKVITIQATQFSYYDRDSAEIYLMRDENGNRLVYKTKRYISDSFEEGSTVKIKATVKEFKEYKGEKQTVLTRLVVL